MCVYVSGVCTCICVCVYEHIMCMCGHTYINFNVDSTIERTYAIFVWLSGDKSPESVLVIFLLASGADLSNADDFNKEQLISVVGMLAH